MDYIELGPTPVDEDATQCFVEENYAAKNQAECVRFKELLEKLFLPMLPEGVVAEFQVKAFPYDGQGMYREVVIRYDDCSKTATEFAYHVESNVPLTWEDETVEPFEVTA